MWNAASEGDQLLSGMFVEPGVVRARLELAGVRPWTHETPVRHRVLVTLRSPDGTVVEVASVLTGFRSVRVEGSGEGVIAAPLEAVAKAHPDLSLGSYPFFGAEGFGANLVIRGRDPAEVERTVGELIAALTAAGVAKATALEPEG